MLELVQTANTALADMGDTVIFTMRVRNLGNVTLNNVVLTHDFPTATTLPAFSLAPGATVVRTVTHVVGERPARPAHQQRQRHGQSAAGRSAHRSRLGQRRPLQATPRSAEPLCQPHGAASIGDTVTYTYG